MTHPDPERLEDLAAEARYARERADLYRAKTYGSRPTSPARMRELERVAEGAEQRLRRARARGGAAAPARFASGEAGTSPVAHPRTTEEDRMAGDDSRTGSEKPSEQRGGTVPGEREAREKGPWGGTAGEGIVPAELGGSDAPDEMLGDKETGYSDAALGRTTGSNEPATDGGIDPVAGDAADATTDGGPDLPASGEVDTKDIAQAAIQRERDD